MIRLTNLSLQKPTALRHDQSGFSPITKLFQNSSQTEEEYSKEDIEYLVNQNKSLNNQLMEAKIHIRFLQDRVKLLHSIQEDLLQMSIKISKGL